MIRLWIAARTAGRSSRAGRLFGLILLITVHLSGHAHGAAFQDPHLNVPAVMCAPHDADVGVEVTVVGDSGRRHHAHRHIDHTPDRPRGVFADRTDSDPGQDGLAGLAATPVAAPNPARTAAPRAPPPGTRSPYGRSALALHCVWRQ